MKLNVRLSGCEWNVLAIYSDYQVIIYGQRPIVTVSDKEVSAFPIHNLKHNMCRPVSCEGYWVTPMHMCSCMLYQFILSPSLVNLHFYNDINTNSHRQVQCSSLYGTNTLPIKIFIFIFLIQITCSLRIHAAQLAAHSLPPSRSACSVVSSVSHYLISRGPIDYTPNLIIPANASITHP